MQKEKPKTKTVPQTSKLTKRPQKIKRCIKQLRRRNDTMKANLNLLRRPDGKQVKHQILLKILELIL